MLLKERQMDPRSRDDISEALAYLLTGANGESVRMVPAYLYHYYPNGLKAITIGAHSRQLVGVSRFYPRLTPPVVVDFEPVPPEKFWEQEKRKFFTEQGIVYLPIFLRETMDEAGFQARLKAATELMVATRNVAQEDAVLAAPPPTTVEGWLQDARLLQAADREALRRLEAKLAAGHRYVGIVRRQVLGAIKRAVIEELREGMRRRRIIDPLAYLQGLAEQPEPVDA